MHHSKEQIERIKKMGWAFFLLALTFSFITYLLPNQENIYWFSRHGKEGFYVLSTFLALLGLYCYGAVRRK